MYTLRGRQRELLVAMGTKDLWAKSSLRVGWVVDTLGYSMERCGGDLPKYAAPNKGRQSFVFHLYLSVPSPRAIIPYPVAAKVVITIQTY